MSSSDSPSLEEPTESLPVLVPQTRSEVALDSLSRLAVLVALSLALILILGQQLSHPH